MRRRSIGVVAVVALALALVWWRGRAAEAPRAGGALAPGTVEEVAGEPERAAPQSPEPAAAPAREPALATPGSVGTAEADATAPAPALATLDVLVRSKQTGLPIEGARVSVFVEDPAKKGGVRYVDSSCGSASESPITGADGRALFELPPGFPSTLRALGEATPASAEVLELEPFEPGEARELVVELDTAADRLMRGLVLERATRAPIAGARVTLGPTPDPSGEARAVSDAEGRFAVEFAGFERAPLCVAAPGYGYALVPPREGYDAPERALEVLLEPNAALRLTLLDAAGAPLVDARVRLSTPLYELAQHSGLGDHALYNDARWSARTDGRGVARFDALPTRAPLTVAASVGSSLLTGGPEPLRLEPGEERALEWRVGAGAAIVVRALDSGGDVLAGLELALERAKSPTPYFLNSGRDEQRSATTDEAGRARFDDVPPGDWAVAPAPRARHERADDDAAPLAEIVAVPPAGEVEVELRVWRGLWIRGRVLQPDGTPSMGGFLMASRIDGDAFVVGAVERDGGVFAAGPLVPGRWQLVANGRPHAPSEPVEVEAGASDVELRLREGAAVAGIVLDGATGEPMRVGVGIASAADESVRQYSSARDGGEFEFRGLPPGAYHVSASAPGGLFALARGVRADAGGDPARIELRLEPGAVVRLRFEGPADRASAELRSDGAMCAGDGVVRGDELVLTGPPGRATLRLRTWPGGAEHERELDLVAGEELELTFDGGW